MVSSPLAIVKDTGVPSGTQSTHKVLILFHGLAFQSNVFAHVLPFAQAHNARIILVNRREYPGSEPLSQEERDILNTAQGDGALAADAAKRVFAARADEILSLLEGIVEKGDVPQRSMILVGWSLAAFYMTSLLARPPAIVGRVDLGQYIRRVICYDTGHALLGFPQPAPDMYNPFTDPSIAPQDIGAAFVNYVTGYYSHTIPHTPGIRASSIVDGLEQRIPKKNTSFTPEELASVVFSPPADVPTGGADILHYLAAQKHGLFAVTLEAALRGERWPLVELREVWGDASFWEGCAAGIEFGRLVHEDKQTPKGEIGRPASAVRWIGTNHFAHWDYPERTLIGLLEDGVEDWTVVSS